MVKVDRNRLGLVVSAFALSIPGLDMNLARGQETSTEEASGSEPGFDWTFSGHTRYDFRSDLEGTDNGDFAVWRSGFDVSLQFPISPIARLTFGLGYEYNNYDFDQPNSFLPTPAAEPFSDIHILDLSTLAQFQVDEQWSWYGGAGIRAAGESGADFGDSTTLSGRAGVGYRFSDTFEMTLGALVSTQIEDDVLILPAVTATWNINERWDFTVSGPGMELTYEIDRETWIGLAGSWEKRRFRLEDDVLGLGSVIEETAIPVYLHLKRVTGKGLSLNLAAGALVGREFDIEDHNGRHGRTIDGDAGLFASLGFTYEF